jgi:hypothetical protein
MLMRKKLSEASNSMPSSKANAKIAEPNVHTHFRTSGASRVRMPEKKPSQCSVERID